MLPALTQRVSRWSMLAGSVRGRRRTAADDGGSQTEMLIAAMRRLRDMLFDGGKPPRGHSLLIASATPGEGRTTVALNLALTAAAEGWRVLLVDADINRAMLSKTLDAAGNAGLLDLIEGRATLASVLLNDTDTGLNFLPLGNATRSESRMPVAQELAQKLADQTFDLTIIDTGAMLTDDYTRPFAEFADDLLLVVRAGGPKKDEIQAALGALRLNARKVRGAVLTCADASA